MAINFCSTSSNVPEVTAELLVNGNPVPGGTSVRVHALDRKDRFQIVFSRKLFLAKGDIVSVRIKKGDDELDYVVKQQGSSFTMEMLRVHA